MAFSKKTLTLIALVSASTLALACSDDETTAATGGSGGTGNNGGSATGGNNTGGSQGGMGGSQGGMGGTAMPTSCTDYCTDVIANCNDGTNDQYYPPDAQTACEDMCARFDDGMPGDMGGDTRECRVYHSGVASIDAGSAATHCPHAGPFGGGVCGAANQCESFCAQHVAICAGTPTEYGSEADCITACTDGVDDEETPFVAANVPANMDTFACRGFHLQAAAASIGDQMLVDLHCGHSTGLAPCATP